jgi:hypothetical protein
VVSRKKSREYKDRIEALTERVGAIAPGVEKAFRASGRRWLRLRAELAEGEIEPCESQTRGTVVSDTA